jgi:SAM-dependent methyltransferase
MTARRAGRTFELRARRSCDSTTEAPMTDTLEATRPDRAAKPDLAAIKQRQQQTWASGDFGVVAARIVLVAEQLCDSADLHAGWHVLDVATGTGNAAIAAARLGCSAVGVDYVPALLERGRRRAAAEGLSVTFLDGDAESLPFPNDSFDAVTSVFGSMFAPDHARAAGELLRVCRPGGTIALASWTPDGFIGELFRTVGAHVPPPAGVPAPMLWGTERHLRELLGDSITSLELTERTFTFRFPSAADLVSFFRRWYGPTLKAFAALEGEAREALERDLVALAERFDRLGGDAIAIPATYAEAVAIKR